MRAHARVTVAIAITFLLAVWAAFLLSSDNAPAPNPLPERFRQASNGTTSFDADSEPAAAIPAAVALSASNAEPTAADATYRLSGVVVDETETPQPGIQVTLTRWYSGLPIVRADAVTDAQGRFDVEGLVEGNYAATLARVGVANPSTEVAGTKRVGPEEQLTNVRFYVKERTGPGISGIVLDVDGEPIMGASVVIEREVRSGHSHRAVTGPDGRFNVGGLAQGRYLVGARHPRYSETTGIGVIAPASNVGVVLRPLAVIEGRVIDDETGAPITAFRIGSRGVGWPSEQAGALVDELRPHADPAGEFWLEVGAGRNWIVVHADGYVPVVHAAPLVAPGESVEGLEIRLQPGAVITGTVRDRSGNPVPEAGISYRVRAAQSPTSRPRRTAQATTDAGGTYQLNSVGYLEAELHVTHPDYAPQIQRVKPVRGIPSTVDFILDIGGTVEGTVLIAGQPAAGLKVELAGRDGRSSRRTDHEGTYKFTGLATGPRVVSVTGRTAPDLATVSGQKHVHIVAGESREVNFAFAAGTAAIEALVTQNGESLKDASVGASFEGGEPGQLQHTGARRRNGVYRIEGLPEGEVTVRVDYLGEDEYVRRRYVQVSAVSDETTRVVIELGTGARIAGVVRGLATASGYVIEAYRGIIPVEPEYWEGDVVSSNASIAGSCLPLHDSFDISGLEPGTYTVVVTSTDEVGSPPIPVAHEVVEVHDGEVARVDLALPNRS